MRQAKWSGATGPATKSCRPREIVHPRSTEEIAAAVVRAAAGGYAGACGGRRTLLHRHCLHCRDADPAGPLSRCAGRRSGVGTGARAGRYLDRSFERDFGRARPRARELGRHRCAEHRRSYLDCHPRHRRATAQHSLPGGRLDASACRRLDSRLLGGKRPRVIPRGTRRSWSARGARGGDPALRTRLHPVRDRRSSATRGDARAL